MEFATGGFGFGLQWWDKTATTGILVAGETDQMAMQLAGVMSLVIPGWLTCGLRSRFASL